MSVNSALEVEFEARPSAEDLHFVLEPSLQSAGRQVDNLLLQQKTPNLGCSFLRGFGDGLKFALKPLGFAN
jgi:hypothetical protein